MQVGRTIVAMFCVGCLLLSMSDGAFAQEAPGESPMSGSEANLADVGYTIIRGVNGAERGVFYEKINGLAILEGDIVLGPVEELEPAEKVPEGVAKGVAISAEHYGWTDGVLPYEIDPELPRSMPTNIANAIDHWEANTPIRFVRRTAANASLYPDYVRFEDQRAGCFAFIGRQGGGQIINVSEGCHLVAVIHEIGHALGLFHEQSREDRDQYVRIIWENIQPGMAFNFEKQVINADDIGPYDYDSIMHYQRDAFAKSRGLVTIVPLDPNARIGQSRGLSQGDIATIRTLYDSPVASCQSFAQSFAGRLSGAEEVTVEPDASYYYSPAGTHQGRLEGPLNTDFNLFLFYWTGSAWVVVAESIGDTSDEAIAYSGTSGAYSWRIQSYQGSGDYTFCMNRP